MKRLHVLPHSLPTLHRCALKMSHGFLLGACLSVGPVYAGEVDSPSIEPLFEVVDLAQGESAEVTLSDGSRVELRLLDVEAWHDPVREAVRRSVATVVVNGEEVAIEAGNYNLPIEAGGVQIDCPITSSYNDTTDRDHWQLRKDARFRLWPEGSPWVRPGTFQHPLGQRFLATGTQSGNEPTYIDGGERPERRPVYYHAGFDFAGYEGRTEVFSATDGVVMSAAGQHLDLEEHPPVRPRYDVVYIRDNRGWYYRYSHLKSIETVIQPGEPVSMGDKIGDLGKEGHSGGYAHLHFDISMRMPSGEYGIHDAYPFVWQAYRAQFDPPVIAVARPHVVAQVGDEVRLDGSRSWAKAGVASYEWTLPDGRNADGPQTTATYDQPGTYSEILKVVSEDGDVAYDFQEVQILHSDPEHRVPPTIDMSFHPTAHIQAGDPVRFAVRSFRVVPGEGFEEWDFGDGSPPVRVESNPVARDIPGSGRHAPDGYAHTIHRFQEPGDYVVTVQRTNNEGYTATGRLHVVVEEREDESYAER